MKCKHCNRNKPSTAIEVKGKVKSIYYKCECKGGDTMFKFLSAETTLGKSLKTLVWVALSAALTAIGAYISQNQELFNPVIVGLVNIALVAAKNLKDPKVKNF